MRQYFNCDKPIEGNEDQGATLCPKCQKSGAEFWEHMASLGMKARKEDQK